MTTTLIISKKSVNLELIVDGKVEVKALPDNVLGEETVKLLAETYQHLFNAHARRHKTQNILEVAIQFFEKKGFTVKQINVNP